MTRKVSASTEGVGPRVNLETILVNEVGQFGPYQWRTLALAALVICVSALSTSEFIFTAARIEARCYIPECEQLDGTQIAPEWLGNAVPPSSSGDGFDGCIRFVPRNVTNPDTDTCPAEIFDQSVTVSCSQHVYEHTNTVAYEFDLACRELQRSLIGTARTLGTLVALPLTGFVSDRWGRRTALTLIAFNTAWIGALRYFAYNYIGHVISVFCESAFGAGGMLSTAYILVMEVVGPDYREAAAAANNSFFAVGQMLLGLLAWGVPYWRHLTLVIYIPQLLTFTYYWLFPESIRWYLSKGRFENAEANLKQIARVNKKNLSDKSLEALRETARLEKEREEFKKDEPLLISLVWRHKPILLRCCVLPVWWITMTFTYYGLQINAVSMSGNQYVNFIAVAAVEIPGFWLSLVLVGRLGRKPIFITAFWLCAACQIAYIFIPQEYSLPVYLLGKFAISCVVFVLYLFTAELFPTSHRHSLFAFCSMAGRIGSITAPLTPALGQATFTEIPFVIFAVLSLISGGLVFLIPETLGEKMPDTMEEAVALGKKKTSANSQEA